MDGARVRPGGLRARSRASTSVTSAPSSARYHAVISPAMPPPMTSTSVFGRHLGAHAAHVGNTSEGPRHEDVLGQLHRHHHAVHAEGGAAIDYEAWERFLDWQLACGVPGIIILGTTGEFLTMTDDERGAFVEATVKHIAGRIPVHGRLDERLYAERGAVLRGRRRTLAPTG